MKNVNHYVAVGIILLVVGGLNWGLVGIFNFDLVEFLFGSATVLTRIVYTLVGLAAVGIGIWLPSAACGCTYLSRKSPSSAG